MLEHQPGHKEKVGASLCRDYSHILGTSASPDLPQKEEDILKGLPTQKPLTMSSREIAELTGKMHRNVVRDIEKMLKNIGEGVLKFEHTYTNNQNGQEYREFLLPKNLTLNLVLGYRDDLRLKVVDRWLELEARAAQPYKVPQTYAAALLEAGRLALENERLTAECEALLPRAEAHDRLSAADGSLSVTEAAKALKVKPKTLFAWLSRNGWIYRRAGSARWLGYQAHTSNGDLEHKTTTITYPDGSEKITEQVRVTAKGLTKLAKIARDIE